MIERENYYLLHKSGLVNSTELFIFNGKICFRSNSSGGEHFIYVSINSEERLFRVFEPKKFIHKFLKFLIKKTALEKVRQEKIMKHLAKKFTYGEEDPSADIISFFKENNIKSIGEYWPDSDRF